MDPGPATQGVRGRPALSLRLGITLGDPAGIGPEVVAAALRQRLPLAAATDVCLFGPRGLADSLATELGLQSCVQAPFEGPMGRASAASGTAALAALAEAVDWARSRRLDALVTAPICKAALAAAGSPYLGHTDYLTDHLGDGGPTAMAFLAPQLRVVLASVHLPLRQAVAELSTARVVAVAQRMAALLRERLGIADPRLGLAGLNPHAGEGGLMGDEEIRLLDPAVAQLRGMGIDMGAPESPDVVFRRAADGAYDAVVALYHDQGLIPVKMLSFGGAVNLTLGLTLVRTSPDHGTAYSIVGTGRARPEGMLAALDAAILLTGGQGA